MSWHLKICVTPFFSVDTGDPKFNKSTLFIPPNEFAKLGPFEQQYWGVSSNFCLKSPLACEHLLSFPFHVFYDFFSSVVLIALAAFVRR